MQLLTDDPVHEVNSEFLGPKGWLLPWRARYIAYVIGFALAAVLVGVERRIGVHVGALTVLYDLAAVIFATRYLGKFVDHERPARTLAFTFWHEVTAPRSHSRGHRAVLVPGGVKVRRPRTGPRARSLLRSRS